MGSDGPGWFGIAVACNLKLLLARVYNKREEYRTVKMCLESNVILHVWHGIRVT